MSLKDKNNLSGLISIPYFAIAIVEIVAELYSYKPLIYIFKPLIPLTLMILYWKTSKIRHPLFFIAMVFSLVTNIIFIPDDDNLLPIGLSVFMVHRIFILYFIATMLKIKDYIPVVIATIPFLIIFFYLFIITDVPENTFFLLIVQNLLISVLGGIALSNYVMNDNKKNSWLLICGLLFVSLQFIVFIERFYLPHLSPSTFRPIAMGLNTFAFYTFYEFVIATEKSNNNRLAV